MYPAIWSKRGVIAHLFQRFVLTWPCNSIVLKFRNIPRIPLVFEISVQLLLNQHHVRVAQKDTGNIRGHLCVCRDCSRRQSVHSNTLRSTYTHLATNKTHKHRNVQTEITINASCTNPNHTIIHSHTKTTIHTKYMSKKNKHIHSRGNGLQSNTYLNRFFRHKHLIHFLPAETEILCCLTILQVLTGAQSLFLQFF